MTRAKKVMVGIIVCALLSAGAWAVYHFVWASPDSDAIPETEAISQQSEPVPDAVLRGLPASEPEVPPVPYFVISTSATLFSKPNFESDVVGEARLRDEVQVYEQQGRWSRVQAWTNEVTGKSQWIYSEHLSQDYPSQTDVEQYTRLKRLLRYSDDFETNESRFIELTNALLQTELCSEDDIAQVQGWLRSLNYPDEPVYYTYCGGLESGDKLYLNLSSGEWFRAPL